MSRKIKKLLSVICVMCLLVNLLMVHASGNLQIEMGTMEKTNRIPVLTLSVGSEDGQVGYGGTEASGYTGPNSFVVENGTIYVLDAVNHRINVYQNDRCSEIAIENSYLPQGLTYKNGKLAVFDNSDLVTLIYTTAGSLVARIKHASKLKEELALQITDIGDNYVVWETFKGNQFRYDWSKNVIVDTEAQFLKSSSDDTVSLMTAGKKVAQWKVDAENKVHDILGVSDGGLVYQQYEYVPDVDMLFTELSVRKVQADGSECYAIIDFSDWKAHATNPFYLSSDGKLYVMECLDNHTVISEVVLGSTDQSQMETLKQKAEARRLEVEAQAEKSTNTTITIPHTDKRTTVMERAEEMMDYQWKVLPSHKVETANWEAYIDIPQYVINTVNNTYTTGIPYCWGGFHGISGDRYDYTTFASVVGLTNKTAGNTNSDYKMGIVEGTIGLDCVGFMTSAYDMDGTKQQSGYYTNAGLSVALTDLKPMDILVKSGHVMLYAGESNGILTIYEATVVGSASGKAGRNTTRSLSSISDGGYVGRNLFCTTCNTAEGIFLDETYHDLVCSQCKYVWPNAKQPHNQSGEYVISYPIDLLHAPTCSACGFIGAYEDHDENGEMLCEMDEHYYTCSKCEWIGVGEAHIFNSYGYCDICGYDR